MKPLSVVQQCASGCVGGDFGPRRRGHADHGAVSGSWRDDGDGRGGVVGGMTVAAVVIPVAVAMAPPEMTAGSSRSGLSGRALPKIVDLRAGQPSY